MLDRLDFLCGCGCATAAAVGLVRAVQGVVWCGVSFRRFARLWTPGCRRCCPSSSSACSPCCAAPERNAHLGALPLELLHAIVTASADATDERRDDYDERATVQAARACLFLPAPGSADLLPKKPSPTPSSGLKVGSRPIF